MEIIDGALIILASHTMTNDNKRIIYFEILFRDCIFFSENAFSRKMNEIWIRNTNSSGAELGPLLTRFDSIIFVCLCAVQKYIQINKKLRRNDALKIRFGSIYLIGNRENVTFYSTRFRKRKRYIKKTSSTELSVNASGLCITSVRIIPGFETDNGQRLYGL